MKLNPYFSKKIIYLFVLAITLLLILNYPKYKGDGTLVEDEFWSFYSNYEIQFPSFPFEQGLMNQQYNFQGVCFCDLVLKMYFIDDSGNQIRFLGSTPTLEYIAELDIKVKVLENTKTIFERESNLGEDWISSDYYYWYYQFGKNSRILFNSLAKYKLFLTIESEIEPPEEELREPIAVKMQVALGAN